MGNALQTSGDAIYGARHVALKAGVPFDRPALTVNRLCGSGIQAIVSGAQMIQLGEARTYMRPETRIEGLAKLRPAFSKDGFATAGNASGIVDGAAALVNR